MASMQPKAFSVLEFGKTSSVIMVQRAFRRRYGIDPPLAKNIRRWYKQFQETGNSPGRPHTSEENVHRIQEAYQRSLCKSTRRASRELTIPHVTLWHVLRRRLLMKPYRLQLVQALHVGDRRKRTDFCDMLLEGMEDDSFLPRLIFSDEATFHLSGKVRATMFAFGALRIHMKLFSMSAIHRKLTFLARFLLERFMALSFLKETLLREIPILKCCRIGHSHN